MNVNIYDVVGLMGALIIGWFYFYGQYRYTFLNTFIFFIGNIIGSILIISSLILSSFNLPSFVIEVLWISVSFFGIYKYHVLKGGVMEDLTIKQNEFSIDGIPTKINKRAFTKEDLGIEILFKQKDGSMQAETSMTMETFLFNGTTMLTPAAISSSVMGINAVENQWRINKNCYFIELEERDYSKSDIAELFRDAGVVKDKLIIRQENKPVLFLITGFMNKIKQDVDRNGKLDEGVFTLPRAGILLSAAEYIAEMEMFGAIVIDSISFEPNDGGSKTGFETTTTLMHINEQKQTFLPLIYHAKTPDAEGNYGSCSIRLGNVPVGIIPGYPVSVKVK